ncbi:MlaE family lipid ABC transporter permease subunit [Zavarzinia compransoris]|uniref:ABC transporter permease n=1 Tax=Zavarzinia marina TaxID=2911065 RepID=UPI001F3C6270|nr:MlaE family lipid ABC transporter permease subunit [Zavarzinia marina]MCF4166450.1 MlaE family lipid ABC transporter permease subunit [Zavarzinia marina]
MSATRVDASGLLRLVDRQGGLRAELSGRWVVANVAGLERALTALPGESRKGGGPVGGRALEIDLSAVEAIDTVGAWLVHRTAARWQRAGGEPLITGVNEDYEVLLGQVAKADRPVPEKPRGHGRIARMIDGFGRSVSLAGKESLSLISFLGETIAALFRLVFLHPGRFRLTSTFAQAQKAGLEAMPIVGLISFLIGIVIAYQGVDQLAMFGAQIFVVNLVAISVLRELGILLAAIVIAGRSGSSFTAQIGSMKLNEEVDAMRTLGLDPIEVLVVPRVLALMIMLPCLAFFADMMGLTGGMLMSWGVLGIPPDVFMNRLADSVSWKTFAVGIVKAPFFAVTIAVVGCLEGLRVEGSSESVGQRTTQSVVKGIFLVIVLDAAFSIFFATVGI